MTNHERYRRAFAGVHAPPGAALRALARAEEARPRPARRRTLRLALLLAAAAAALTTTVGAELSAGTVSNLLAPLYGGAQTELVDGIGRPVEASATVDGYTLTADAVIGDRYHIAVVYTLTRDDGTPLPENLAFDRHDNSALSGSGGGSLSYLREDMPPHQLRIVEQWSGAGPLLLRRNTRSVFRDLCVHNPETFEKTLLAEGEWELRFNVRCRDVTTEVPVEEGLTVTGAWGDAYRIRRIFLSPLGLHMDLTVRPAADRELPPGKFSVSGHGETGLALARGFSVSLVLADGAVLPLEDTNFSAGGAEGEETLKASFGAFFESPVPPEQVDALEICGVRIPAAG